MNQRAVLSASVAPWLVSSALSTWRGMHSTFVMLLFKGVPLGQSVWCAWSVVPAQFICLFIYLFIHSICLWVQVSHWGRVYVEERYRLRNSGTKVMPPYSRWNITEEAMSGQAAGSPHLRVLPMSLPKTAQYIYTKDDLGHTQVHTQLLDPL